MQSFLSNHHHSDASIRDPTNPLPQTAIRKRGASIILMGQHFLCHRDIVASTAVHHAVHARLTDDQQEDLVVVHPQSLRIYRLEPFPSTFHAQATAPTGTSSSTNGQVLHLLASFALAGVVKSLQVVQFDPLVLQKTFRKRKGFGFHGGSDLLLLSFARFKWVLVGFDRRSRQLVTLAMYTFEENAIGPGASLLGEKNGRDQLLGLSSRGLVKIDPLSRCGAMMVYQDQLVIVPFRSNSMEFSLFDEEDDDDEEDANGRDGNDEEEEDDEEKKLLALVKESQEQQQNDDEDGRRTKEEVNSKLKELLDQSVKLGRKRKRLHAKGSNPALSLSAHEIVANELTGQEFLLRLRELGMNAKIIDFCFLEGYLEPTVMILHEDKDKNSSGGRFASGFDTFCLTVLSINLNTRLHPKIWSVEGLPSDAFGLIPCKAPIGGALVLTPSAFLYFNQTQFCGIGTNVFASRTINQTLFPLMEPLTEEGQEKPNFLLHGVSYAYLGASEFMLSISNGDLYVLSLPVKNSISGSGVLNAQMDESSMRLRKLESNVMASCLCVNKTKQTVFVGSRSGDSILYAYTTKETTRENNDDGGDTTNKANGSEDANEEAGQSTEEDDDDETDDEDMLLYGSSIKKSSAPSEKTNGTSTDVNSKSVEDDDLSTREYELKRIDALPGVGQITSVDLGVEANSDANEKREELVVSGGYMGNGGIAVLHHGLRPIVSTEAELSGCRAMWTVSSSLSTAKRSDDGRLYNSYLILSVGQRTMVLRTGEGMEPLDEGSGFYTSGPTLCATNMFGDQRIIQVFKQGVRVMAESVLSDQDTTEHQEDHDEDEDDGPKTSMSCTQEITLEGDIECGGMDVDTSKVSIVAVDVLDPYILLLLNDGTLRLLVGDDEDLELTVVAPEFSYAEGNDSLQAVVGTTADGKMGICSACLFYDWVGMFKDDAWGEEETQGEDEHHDESRKLRKVDSQSSGHHDDHPLSEEDDDEMDALYSTGSHMKSNSRNRTNSGGEQHHRLGATDTASIGLLKRSEAQRMCGICFDDGSFHVFSLPDFTKKGIFPYLTFAPLALVNTLEHKSEQDNKVSFKAPMLGLNASSSSANEGRIKKSHTFNSPVADIAVHRVGPSEGSGPNAQYLARMMLLVFLANGDLLMYAALPKPRTEEDASRPLAFQFFRVQTDLITRPFVPPKKLAHSSSNVGNPSENSSSNSAEICNKLRAGFRYPMLTRFFNVNGRSGVFFRGAHPVWILCERGEPCLVPMCVSGSTQIGGSGSTPRVSVPVLSFTPFHHWNCPNGFIYFHSKGSLRVCELPSSKTSNVLASSGFVLQKTDFHGTIHHAAFLGNQGPGGVTEALESPTYVVVLSTKMSPEEAEKATENDEGDDASAEEETVPTPTNVVNTDIFPELSVDQLVNTEENVYELRLVQTDEYGEWETEGVFRVLFERHEVVLCMKVMYLYDSTLMKEDLSSDSQEFHQKKRPYVVIGTGYTGPHGEDEGGRGRLLLYEVDYAQYVNDEGETSRKLPKLNLLFIKEHRQGAISYVAQLGAYVLAAVGSKLIMYEFKSEQLIGCAFYDAQLFIVSITIIKDFILYGDVFKSVHFLRWKEKQRQLVLLAKDYEPLAVTSTEFNLFDKKLALLACDMEQNLHVLQFAPNDIESRGGQRLLRTSDFHLGVQVSTMFRKRVTGDHHPSNNTKNNTQSLVYVNILGSSEGSISAVVPVSERVFRRLFTLQNVIINTLPQNCALNPREFRSLKTNGRRRSGRPDGWCKQKWKKGFLDSLVLHRFLNLDYVAQKELARSIGTTPEVIVHNLLEIQRTTGTFL